jgi:hypothetical protein
VPGLRLLPGLGGDVDKARNHAQTRVEVAVDLLIEVLLENRVQGDPADGQNRRQHTGEGHREAHSNRKAPEACAHVAT